MNDEISLKKLCQPYSQCFGFENKGEIKTFFIMWSNQYNIVNNKSNQYNININNIIY